MKLLYLSFLLSVIYSQDTLVTIQWPHINRTSNFKTSVFQGKPCDDTEYRDENGSPAWKNYGGWLSECDSIRTVEFDREFALRDKLRKKQQAKKDSLDNVEFANLDLDVELDLDAMWENTVWNEITDIGEEYVGEVEQITAVAGVRGAEAEDEALQHLYYRRSMKQLALIDLQKAYGKLTIKKDKLIRLKRPTKKIDEYLSMIDRKIKSRTRS